jgi:TonB family protein
LNRFITGLVKTLILLVVVSGVSVDTYTQEIKDNNINLVSKNESLRSVLDKIRKQGNANIVFNDILIDGLKVTCRIENNTIENSIKKVLNDFNIDYRKFGTSEYVLFKEIKPAENLYSAKIFEQQPVISTDTNVVILRPINISGSVPIYPPEAEKEKIEGRVVVRLFISQEGNVEKSLVDSSSGFNILDSAAVDYSSGLKFIPAKANNKPVPIWLTISYLYKIVEKN